MSRLLTPATSTPSAPLLSSTGWSPQHRSYGSVTSQMTFDHEVAVAEPSDTGPPGTVRGNSSTASWIDAVTATDELAE